MKKALIYSAMVLLAGAMACNKTDHVLSGDGHIRFAPTGVETRALVTNDNIQAETFQVYDFIGTTKYIDDQITTLTPITTSGSRARTSCSVSPPVPVRWAPTRR